MSGVVAPAQRHHQGRPERHLEQPGRAPLSVVPRVRTRAARVPFVSLVSLLLLGGVVGLLLFNTSMQQASFATTALERQAATLAARQQTLQVELDALRSPQRVAEQARALGMVLPAAPTFLDLRTDEVVGGPTGGEAPAPLDVRLQPKPPVKPAVLAPAPVVVEVPASRDDAAGAAGPDRSGDTGEASRETPGAQGRNGAQARSEQRAGQRAGQRDGRRGQGGGGR